MATVSVKYFLSTDTGAPTLSGTAGSLITLLDAVLVDGYNSKTLDSLVVSDNVATATLSAQGHGMTAGRVVTIAGATPSGLNGEWVVTGSTSTTFTFATSGISNQTATGTITSKFAPLGWSKAFSGTNKAAYKSSDVAATGFYLRVDDTTTTYASVRGYETMTDVDTGTNLFPTAVQEAVYYQQKSNTANSTARPWVVVGDERMVYFFHNGLGTALANTALYGFVFGDLVTFAAGDTSACVLAAANNSGYGGNVAAGNTNYAWHFDVIGTASAYKKYVARNSANTGTSAVWHGYGVPYGNTLRPFGGLTATAVSPSPVDSGVHIFRIMASDGDSATNGYYNLRGYYPGAYEPWEYQAATDTNTTTIDGKTYLTVPTDTYNAAADGCVFIDVTGPWR